MGNSGYRHPALKQLKEQQARFAPGERRLEQIDRAEKLLAEIDAAKRYPYEYLCFRITGFRPDGAPALILDGPGRPARPPPVRRGPLGDGRPEGRAGDRAGPDGRGREPAVQRLDPDRDAMAAAGAGGPAVRDRRADQGRVPRIERLRGSSTTTATRSIAGHAVPATDRRRSATRSSAAPAAWRRRPARPA